MGGKEGGRAGGTVKVCSTLCYLLPPNGPLSPGSQACLTHFFPPGHVIPPYWPKEHGREAFLGGRVLGWELPAPNGISGARGAQRLIGTRWFSQGSAGRTHCEELQRALSTCLSSPHRADALGSAARARQGGHWVMTGRCLLQTSVGPRALSVVSAFLGDDDLELGHKQALTRGELVCELRLVNSKATLDPLGSVFSNR